MYSNNLAKKYLYQFEVISNTVLQGGTNFCLNDYPSEINSFSYRDQYVVFIHPMDKLVRLQKEKASLKEVRQELNEVINSSFDGIVISDENGVIIHQNPSYEKITGLSVKDCVGRSLRELEEEGIIDNSATLKALKENKGVTITQKINTGTMVLVSAVPIRNRHGEIKKVVNNVRDLTLLNQLQQEIEQLEKQKKEIDKELKMLKKQKNPKLSIIAQSKSMKEVINRSLRVADIDSSVLIQGASGVGKEKILELIHHNSVRKSHSLIRINCGALPENLLESELFGYESGAFTGANKKGKVGLLEAADKGTVFLDEIGEMPSSLQVKLLRVLQEHKVTRIGGTKETSINIRVVAATHRNLVKLIEEGKFREDLYYRLNVIPIQIPSLKDRREDIIPLIYHFLHVINQKYGIHRRISPEALDMFKYYDWPGNVRELENFVERISLMTATTEIGMEDVRKELQGNDALQTAADKTKIKSPPVKPLKNSLANYESQIIKESLGKHDSIRKTALALEVDQSTLVRKMKRYGIEK